jgi:hypothetical protein
LEKMAGRERAKRRRTTEYSPTIPVDPIIFVRSCVPANTAWVVR